MTEADVDVLLELTRLGYPIRWLLKVLRAMPPTKNDPAVQRARRKFSSIVAAATAEAQQRASSSRRGPGGAQHGTTLKKEEGQGSES